MHTLVLPELHLAARSDHRESSRACYSRHVHLCDCITRTHNRRLTQQSASSECQLGVIDPRMDFGNGASASGAGGQMDDASIMGQVKAYTSAPVMVSSTSSYSKAIILSSSNPRPPLLKHVVCSSTFRLHRDCVQKHHHASLEQLQNPSANPHVLTSDSALIAGATGAPDGLCAGVLHGTPC